MLLVKTFQVTHCYLPCYLVVSSGIKGPRQCCKRILLCQVSKLLALPPGSLRGLCRVWPYQWGYLSRIVFVLCSLGPVVHLELFSKTCQGGIWKCLLNSQISSWCLVAAHWRVFVLLWEDWQPCVSLFSWTPQLATVIKLALDEWFPQYKHGFSFSGLESSKYPRALAFGRGNGVAYCYKVSDSI